MANEKRLIDANALEAAITVDYYEHFTQCHDTDQIALIDMVRDDIGNAPTVDAVEVVHAYWTGSRFNPMTDEYEEYCSDCCAWSSEYGKPYCPNCGAKMDGERREGE